MRRSLAVLVAATAVSGATAAPAAAQTLDIRFQAVTTKPHGTCEATFCAPVSVPGYGEGTLTYTDESFVVISPSCAEYTGVAEIVFVDPNVEKIVTAESGIVCFPGNSFNAPGGFRSYGNPFRQEGTLVIDEGPAALDEASGTSNVRGSGAALHGVYSIDLE